MQPSRYVAHTVVLNTREQETGLCPPFRQLHTTQQSPSKSETRPFMVLPLAWAPGTYSLRTQLISQMYKRGALQALRIRGGGLPLWSACPRLLLQRRVSNQHGVSRSPARIMLGAESLPNPLPSNTPRMLSVLILFTWGEHQSPWVKGSVLQDCPPNFKCQMDIEVITCASYQPAIVWKSLQSLLWVQFLF